MKRKYESELLNIVKAIINKFGSKEISITREELERAKKLEVYISDDFFHFSKIYRVIEPRQLLNSFKNEEE